MGKLATIPGADLAAKINAAHRAVYLSFRQAAENAAECGRLLIEAKETVGHGEWLPWLEAHTEVGERQCQKYMELARGWDRIRANSDSYLTIKDALKLLSDPKPKPPAVGSDEYERDRKECIALAKKAAEAERELANAGCKPEPASATDGDDEPKREPILYLEFARGAAKSARETARMMEEDVDDGLEITDELMKACEAASRAWDKLATRLIKKQASTLPADDIGDIPPELDRRRH